MNKKKLYARALKKWGEMFQIVMIFEEMSELTKALTKYLRGKEGRIGITEEIVDVQIMCEQLIQMFGTEEAIPIIKKRKLLYLQQLLKRK